MQLTRQITAILLIRQKNLGSPNCVDVGGNPLKCIPNIADASLFVLGSSPINITKNAAILLHGLDN
jgi:hypothetical protein